MICISCQTEINPKWTSAIEKNECPFCGQVILDEELKTMLSSLRGLLDALQDFPSELDDWMLSNFSYIKTTSDDLVNYVSPELIRGHGSKVTKHTEKIGDQDVIIEKTQSEKETNGFHARALNKKGSNGIVDDQIERNRKLREIANKIKLTGETDIDSDGEPVEGSENFEQEYAGVMQGQSLPSSNDEELPAIIEAQLAKGGDKPQTAADFKILQKLKMKEFEAQEGAPQDRTNSAFSRSS